MATITAARSPDATDRRGPGRAWFVLTLFFLSGAASLGLEVVWSRMLVTLLGGTTWGVMAVLVAYMSGLGLGSYVWGKRVERSLRPLAVYGALEIGVGLYALAVPWLFSAIGGLYGALGRSLGEAHGLGLAIRIVAAELALLLPTMLMGGTLPALTRALAASGKSAGPAAGTLYAANTLGAVVGCFLTGFVLILALGVSATNALAAAIDVVLGVLAIGAGRWFPAASEEACADRVGDEAGAGARRVVLLLAAGSGFCGLAYEILWNRALLAALTENTTYAFTLMLSVFLAGHALGSWIACRSYRSETPGRSREWTLLGLLQGMAGATALASLPLLLAAEDALSRYVVVGPRSTFWGLVVPFHLAVCLLVVFVPAAFLGASFPVMARLYVGGRGRGGASAGRLYAMNTLGSILGAVATAALLVPGVGTQRALVGLALAQGSAGMLVYLAAGGRRGWASRLNGSILLAAALAGGAGLNHLLTLGGLYERKEPGKLLALDEGPGATVSVHRRQAGDLVINIDGVNVAGTNRVLRTTQKLQAHLPLLLHPAPRTVLQIGFGSGGTCHSVRLHREIAAIDVAELSPGVLAMADAWFGDINHGVLKDPRVQVHVVDARSYMAVTDRTYDLILSDSIHPRYRGNAALYTRDYFALCARRLRPGGLVSTWLPLYGISTDDLRRILASMRAVFPHVQVWYPNSETNEHSVVVGSLTPIRIEWPRFRARLAVPAIAADLAEVGMTGPVQLADFFLVGDRGAATLAGRVELNTDDRPLLEFLAPWTLHRLPAWSANFAALCAAREPVLPYIDGADAETRAALERWYTATTFKLAAQSEELAGRFADAIRDTARCVELNPDDRLTAVRLSLFHHTYPDLLRTPHGSPRPNP